VAGTVCKVRVEFWWVNPKERDHLEDLDVGVRIFY